MGDDLEKGLGNALSGALANMLFGRENKLDHAYLALLNIGYPINESSLDFTQATPFRFYGGTSGGDAKKNEQLQSMAKNAASFAALVNAIPRAVGDWVATDRTLDEFYRNTWLTFIDVPSQQLSTATQAAYLKAQKDLGHDPADDAAIADLDKSASELDKTAAGCSNVLEKLGYEDAAQKVRDKIQKILERPKTIYEAYAKCRNAYQKAIADLNLQLNTDASDDYKIRTLRDAVSNALDDWQALGNKAKFEQATATVKRVDSTDLSKTVEGLKSRFDQVRELNNAGANAFVPVGLIPANFHKLPGNWSRISIDEQKLRDTSSYDHTVSSGGSGPGIFWRSDASSSDTTTRITTSSSSKLSVSFEVARVVLDRSTWFDANLLTSTMWKWADSGDNQQPPPAGGLRLLSDGEVPSSNMDLMLPMYATEILVARNVRVSWAMSDSENTEFHRQVTTSSRSGFWVFGSSHTETHTEDRSTYTWSAGTATLTIPGMQIIGFICDRLPRLPNPSF
jgi:hypothetical protein